MSEGVFSLTDQLAARTRRRNVKAVVLAGGRGTRLAPYTSVLPKPLMPIGDRSILELVLGQLAACGIADVTLCVGYLSHLIQAVLGNRVHDGVDITYVHEEEALGTAAPLRLVPGLDKTFIVMNGDVLTTLDYAALLRYHRRNRSEQPRRGLYREASYDVDRQHGNLRTRAGGADLPPADGPV
jgi:NDP-sugar pyrophosphorylase family protein